MGIYSDLPFERGTTYYEGDTAAIAADSAGPTGLEGKIFDVLEGSQLLRLMVVKNAGSTLTTPAGKGVKPAAGYMGRRISAFVDSTAGFGYPVDPDHVGDWVAGDYGYVVIEGFAADAVLGASNAVDLGVCVFNNAGQLIPVSTNEGHIVGRFAEAVTSTGAGNERVDVIVSRFESNYHET